MEHVSLNQIDWKTGIVNKSFYYSLLIFEEILSLSIYPYHSGPFSGRPCKKQWKKSGPVCLGGVPTASLWQWNGMEWNGKRACESVHVNLSVNWTGPSVTNGLISPFGGFRSFSFTWPVTLYIWWNKRKFLHEESVQLDSGFQSIIGFRIPWAVFRIPKPPATGLIPTHPLG